MCFQLVNTNFPKWLEVTETGTTFMTLADESLSRLILSHFIPMQLTTCCILIIIYCSQNDLIGLYSLFVVQKARDASSTLMLLRIIGCALQRSHFWLHSSLRMSHFRKVTRKWYSNCFLKGTICKIFQIKIPSNH